jgi:hypothetical protein
MSFYGLGDADHVLEDNPFGLEELYNADILKKEPVLGIGFRPRSLIRGRKPLTGRTAEHYQIPVSNSQ